MNYANCHFLLTENRNENRVRETERERKRNDKHLLLEFQARLNAFI